MSLICDPCTVNHCWDCQGYCWHGCVSDEYDPADDDRPSGVTPPGGDRP